MTIPIRKAHPLFKIANGALVDLPAPSNISAWWNFGSLLGICLGIQILTGLFLAMHYTARVDLAFSRVAHICRDVNYGWLLRTIHANGASFFFICLYLHTGRGIYYGSYLFLHTWSIGVIIIFLVMGTAFLGYVLPWGQISFWGATVITNLASAIPYVGTDLVQWLWGGFAVDNATLTRFFYIPFLISVYCCSCCNSTLIIFASNRVKQPSRTTKQYRQNPFSSLFYAERHLRDAYNNSSPTSTDSFRPLLIGRPR